MESILKDKDVMRRIPEKRRRWVKQQAHAMAIHEIPIEAIEKIVIKGKIIIIKGN